MNKLAILAVAFAGCATTAPTPEPHSTLLQQANITLGAMRAHDPALDSVLNASYGFAVFPDNISYGGRGVLYERGRASGYVMVDPATIGSSLRNRRYSELIVLTDPQDVEQLKTGHVDATANDQAFVQALGGDLIDVSVSGERIDYQPAG